MLVPGSVLVTAAGIAAGPVPIPLSSLTRILGHELGFGPAELGAELESHRNIVMSTRIPRVLLGFAVGAGLALAGCVVQVLVRNILAEPYLLGISSGATAGAAASILFGYGSALGVWGLTGSAFAGAIAAIVLVLAVSGIGGTANSTRLILAGIAVSFMLAALTNFMVFASQGQSGARSVLFWMLGSLQQARWEQLAPTWLTVVLAGAVFWLWSRRLDALALGDDASRSLGIDAPAFRRLAFLLVAFLVAVVVSVSGSIGFVGLVVPHLARRAVGAVHRLVLPVSALMGGSLLVAADLVARTAFAPRELPLGILTALLGTPLLLILVHRFNRRRNET
ncbi:FecCD family ABC transporter permease [Sediminivirga luteola]|uniref:ABC transporter permease n=1 Tax=Sediminivirga luteola TaxID=1774748 RepID=A0A8J2XLP1_9MICO|nr:iron ABC transporter permease [Sediminivirga luteola]GGA23617.1 ABC transporter permease [Sediminivirga luteola]